MRDNRPDQFESPIDPGAPRLVSEGEPFRDHEFRIRDPHEGEYPAQICLRMFERRGRAAIGVDAAAGERDDDALAARLTRTLKSLERDGMVLRTVYPTVPPQVEYELTALGHSLSEPVIALGAWAHRHIAEIDGHRARYDSAGKKRA